MDLKNNFPQDFPDVDSGLSGPYKKRVLTLKEVGEFTGLSKNYLYKLTSNRAIPHYKPTGKTIYFDRQEIEDWMLRGKVKQKEVIDAEAASHTTMKRNGGVS